MLSTKVLSSASNAKSYYSHADYYGAEAKGIWFGSGTNDFGLKGEFEAKSSQEFKDLLEGKMPDGRLLGNLQEDGTVKHRPGVDLTFSSPKTVSVQMHVLGSKEERSVLEEARMKALQSTLKYIEESKMVYTRKGAGGKIREPLEKLTFAMFVHSTNRKLEPQDHVHCLLANAAKCQDGKYRTIVWDEVLRNNKLIGQIFRNELALEVQKCGYEIITTRLSDGSSSFELKHVSPELIDAFSTRRKELVELFKRFNVTTKEGKDKVVINSRESKKTLSLEELKSTWSKIAQSLERKSKSVTNQEIKTQGNSLGLRAKEFDDNPGTEKQSKNQIHNLSIEQISTFALSDLTHYKSVFRKEDMYSIALKYSIGQFSIKDVQKGLDRLIKTKEILESKIKSQSKTTIGVKNPGRWGSSEEELLTSKELLHKEKEILKIVKSSKGKFAPIINTQDFEKRYKYHGKQNKMEFTLNKDQKRAVKHVLCSKDKMIIIEGLPGVGKSTVLETVRSMSRRKVLHIGTAPTASASKTLEDSSGISSSTLHSFLGNFKGYLEGRGTQHGLLQAQTEFEKAMVFVDEASLVATRQMHDFMRLSEILKFRIVQVGDSKQLNAVEAGKPFEQTLDVTKSAKLSQIIRQKDKRHIEAIESVANNQILRSFKIHEGNIKDGRGFVSSAVNKYMSLSSQEKEKTMLISPSRKHRDEANQSIVWRLKQDGTLKGQSQEIEIYKTVEFTKSDYNFARNYRAGNVVKFNKDYKVAGIKRGDYLEIVGTNQSINTLLLKNNSVSTRFQLNYNTEYISKLEVFEKDSIELTQGIKLRVTKNHNELINSETIKIKELDLKNKTTTVELEDKSIKTISLSELKHVDYGYCSTVHSAQGKTTERLISVISSNYHLNNQKSWLVTISRHKSEIHLYMQDREKTQKCIIENTGTEKSAIDITKSISNSARQKVL